MNLESWHKKSLMCRWGLLGLLIVITNWTRETSQESHWIKVVMKCQILNSSSKFELLELNYISHVLHIMYDFVDKFDINLLSIIGDVITTYIIIWILDKLMWAGFCLCMVGFILKVGRKGRSCYQTLVGGEKWNINLKRKASKLSKFKQYVRTQLIYI